MNLIVILAIFLVPMASIITIKGTIVWFPQLLMLQFMGGIFFASRFWKLNKILSIFIVYLFFSYIYVSGDSPRTMLCLLIGLMAISTTLIVSEIKSLKWIYIALTVMACLSIAYTFLQKFGTDPIFLPLDRSTKIDIVSFFGSHNQLGIYSAANAFWEPWLIPLAVIPIFFAKCNSALIGLMAGGAVYTYFQFGKKTLIICILAILILLVPWWHFCKKSSYEISERFNLWRFSISQLVHGKIEEMDFNGQQRLVTFSPWVGEGLGGFFTYSPLSQYKMLGLSADKDNYTNGKIGHFYEHAHNDFIEALCEFGYFGIIIVSMLIFSVVMFFINSIKTPGVILTFSSLVAQSVASCSVYVFHAPVSLFIFCLTLGLFYGEANHAKQSEINTHTT